MVHLLSIRFLQCPRSCLNEQNPDRPITLETVDMAGSDRQTKLLVALQTGEGAPTTAT